MISSNEVRSLVLALGEIEKSLNGARPAPDSLKTCGGHEYDGVRSLVGKMLAIAQTIYNSPGGGESGSGGGGGADTSLSNLTATGEAHFAPASTEPKRAQLRRLLNAYYKKIGNAQPKNINEEIVGLYVNSLNTSAPTGYMMPSPYYVAVSVFEGYDFIFAFGTTAPNFTGTAWDGIVPATGGTFTVFNRFTKEFTQVTSGPATNVDNEDMTIVSSVGSSSSVVTLKAPMQITAKTGYTAGNSALQYNTFQAFSPVDLNELALLGNTMETKMNKVQQGANATLDAVMSGFSVTAIDLSRLVAAGTTPWPGSPTVLGNYVFSSGTLAIQTRAGLGGIDIKWTSNGQTAWPSFVSSGASWTLADRDDPVASFDALTRQIRFKTPATLDTMPNSTVIGQQQPVTSLIDLLDISVVDGEDLLAMIEALQPLSWSAWTNNGACQYRTKGDQQF